MLIILFIHIMSVGSLKLSSYKSCHLVNTYDVLLQKGYIKNSVKFDSISYQYLSKSSHNKVILFVQQNHFKNYMKYRHNIDVSRCPYEAYIVEYLHKSFIYTLEKKEDIVERHITKLKNWDTS